MKKPFAYISAAWSGQEFTDTDQAVVYCRKVYQAGFKIIPFEDKFPRDTQLYRVMTTKPSDLAA